MGSRRVDSGELGGGLHSRFLRNEAASAIETHWWNPHLVPVGVLVIGRWLHLPFRGPDELLIFQDADGGGDVRIVRPERRDRLRAKVVRQFATWLRGEEDPVLIVPRILLGGLKPVVGPPGLLDVRPTLLADAQLNNELLG